MRIFDEAAFDVARAMRERRGGGSFRKSGNRGRLARLTIGTSSDESLTINNVGNDILPGDKPAR